VSVDPAGLDRDELLVLVAELVAQIAVMRSELEELRRRMSSDSSNSSRPPSSDSPFVKRPAPKGSALRKKSGRKPGKQPGAPGSTMRQVENPDAIIVCPPSACAGCGGDLTGAPVYGTQRRQVFEVVEPPPPKVTEYRVISKSCLCCGTVTVGEAPVFAQGRAQWGPGVLARAVWLSIGQHIPYQRTAIVLAALAGLKLSTGFLVKARRRAAARLETFMEHVRTLLHRAGLLHVDETTARTGGSLKYLHVACNDQYTAMHVGGRAIADIDAGGILPGYTGILVRDGYSGYQHLTGALHVWCGAHSLRDLKGLYDADPAGQAGANAMADTLVLMLNATYAARAEGRDSLSDGQLATFRSYYAGAIARMRQDNAAAATILHQRGNTLANRFDQHRDMILRFLFDLAAPFSNNAAEREVRGVKVHQRVAGCWRTLAGLADYAVIHSYLSTAAKWGVDHLDALTRLFHGEPWLPPDPA
jgi:transposase